MKIERLVYGNLASESKSGWRVQAQSPGWAGGTQRKALHWCGSLQRAAREAGETRVCFGMREGKDVVLGLGGEGGRDGYGRPGGWQFRCVVLRDKSLSMADALLLAGDLLAEEKWAGDGKPLAVWEVDTKKRTAMVAHQRHELQKGAHPVFGELTGKMAACLQSLEASQNLENTFVVPRMLRVTGAPPSMGRRLLPACALLLAVGLGGMSVVAANLRKDLQRSQTALSEAREARSQVQTQIGEMHARLERVVERNQTLDAEVQAQKDALAEQRGLHDREVAQFRSEIEAWKARVDALESARVEAFILEELQALRDGHAELMQERKALHEILEQIRDLLPEI